VWISRNLHVCRQGDDQDKLHCHLQVQAVSRLTQNAAAAAITLSPPGDLFAIKVMTKTDLVRKNMVESVTNERNILAMVGHFVGRPKCAC
jgi:hypothetical protein